MNNALRTSSIIPEKRLHVPLSRPDITDLERRYVMEVLETSQLSIGPRLVQFESQLARFAGVKHAIAVNSGTSALHLIVKALGIEEDDEVITTPFSFISSSNCIVMERAKPVFVDIEPITYNIDPELIEQAITEKTKAILAVDVFGHPAQWKNLEFIARKHNLKLIEDSAEATGSEYFGRKCGSFGDAGIFAFYPNKQITTGEGGAVLTDNDNIALLCRSMRNQGRDEGDAWLLHSRLGYNYRISEINCALGIAQMERIDEIVNARARVAKLYDEYLKDLPQLITPKITMGVNLSYFVYVIRLSDEYTRDDRDQIMYALKTRGVGCNDYFNPIHTQPMYQKLGYRKGDFPITEAIGSRTIALPFHNKLSEEEIEYVVQQLKDVL